MLNLVISGGTIFTQHMTGLRHPESSARYLAVDNALRQAGLWQLANSLPLRMATLQELALCHDRAYIALVEQACRRLRFGRSTQLSTGDVMISEPSYQVACTAVGAALAAVDAVLQGFARRAFCPVRPPGHHATKAHGMGFCLFNNAAIAARYAQRTYGIERVAILDWDVHHGNGTQDIFYADPSVFYFSTHQAGSYPGSGAASERGCGAAIGMTCNIPLAVGPSSRIALLNAFAEPLAKEMARFKPQLILVSAGFDAHVSDPLAAVNLTTEDFATLTQLVVALAEHHCQGRLISLLEGGYDLQALAHATLAHVQAL